jgi:hypothetical protein
VHPIIPTDDKILIGARTQALNFLHMQRVLQILCWGVSNHMKTLTPDEIRQHYNIKNDLTAADLARIRSENRWVEEKPSDETKRASAST